MLLTLALTLVINPLCSLIVVQRVVRFCSYLQYGNTNDLLLLILLFLDFVTQKSYFYTNTCPSTLTGIEYSATANIETGCKASALVPTATDNVNSIEPSQVFPSIFDSYINDQDVLDINTNRNKYSESYNDIDNEDLDADGTDQYYYEYTGRKNQSTLISCYLDYTPTVPPSTAPTPAPTTTPTVMFQGTQVMRLLQ